MQKIKEMINSQLNKSSLYYLCAFLLLTFLSFLFAHPVTGFLGGLILMLSDYTINTLAILSLSLFVLNIFKINSNLLKIVLSIALSLIITAIPFTKDILNL